MLTNRSIRTFSCGIFLLGAATLGVHSAMAAEATAGCNAIFAAIPHSAKGSDTTLYQVLGDNMTDGISAPSPSGGVGVGLPLHQWGVIVDRNGVVCTVVTSAGPNHTNLNQEWLGSRVIAAQKANTVNDFSVDSLALSSANLWAASQPGGSLFGLQFSNPVDTSVAYGDNSNCSNPGCDKVNSAPAYGQPNDPMVGHYIGGVNVFGGGLALYDASGTLIGGLGTSGNTSCADHYISWIVRHRLGLDYVPAGVAPGGDHGTDNIIFDVTGTTSTSGFGHPLCGIDANEASYPGYLETHYPTSSVPTP